MARLSDRLKNDRPVEGWEPLNLDSMDEETLRDLDAVCTLLSIVAYHMAEGKRHRLAGDIELALGHERIADAEYKRLPKWAQW